MTDPVGQLFYYKHIPEEVWMCTDRTKEKNGHIRFRMRLTNESQQRGKAFTGIWTVSAFEMCVDFVQI